MMDARAAKKKAERKESLQRQLSENTAKMNIQSINCKFFCNFIKINFVFARNVLYSVALRFS